MAVCASLPPAQFAAHLPMLARRTLVGIAVVGLALASAGATNARAERGALSRNVTDRSFAATRSPCDVWRVLGHLHASDGSRFDVAVTFFRYSLGPAPTRNDRVRSAWASTSLDASTLSLVDETSRRATTGVRVEREALGLAGTSTSRVDMRVDDWTLRSDGRARRNCACTSPNAMRRSTSSSPHRTRRSRSFRARR
ncbi:MAG: hypothetical protein IAI49_06590 [Candidatus Eremiobacteraeota bacterium]|nr:hypothetical protein [Candidatus Eremiobacteraeota bacterium]